MTWIQRAARGGVLCLAFPAAALSAQEILRWEEFEPCDTRCQLDLVEVARFGDVEGPGIVEGAYPFVAWGENAGYLLFDHRGRSLKAFDEDGGWRRSIGRPGGGPGEFEHIIGVQVVDGRIVLLDLRKRAWLLFDEEGAFLDQRLYGLAAGPFLFVGDQRVVVFAMDRRPSYAGYPLHLVDLREGTPSLHFGMSENRWVATDFFAGAVVNSVLSPPGTVWTGRPTSPSVHEWSIDGELLRSIEGELPWFKEVTEDWVSREEPEPTLLRYVALDHDERLWMMTTVADPDWRDAPPDGQGDRVEPGIREDELPFYADVRLDVFDLEERRHLGFRIWDELTPQLFDRQGEIAINVLEYLDGVIPQVVIYRPLPE